MDVTVGLSDAFELWCWRRLLRLPWTARRWNQSILKEISPEYSLEGWCWSWSSNTLATWWKELTPWKGPWCWERLRTGGEGADRGWDGWMASLIWWTWVWASSGSWWWTGKPGLQSMGWQSWTWLSNWTELNSNAYEDFGGKTQDNLIKEIIKGTLNCLESWFVLFLITQKHGNEILQFSCFF